MKKNLLYTAALSAVLLASCTSEKTAETQAAAAAQPTAAAPVPHANHIPVATAQTQADPSAEELMTREGLPKDLVCMVNNAYMGKKQFPVPFENKMYYGCCEMCVNTIQQQRKVRHAVDPVTGEEVDKSLAFIALKPGGANGDVLYFASEENYRKYMQ
ncbi:hypothetical protein [Pontibacter amylolyticus]|uniref:MlpB protein n=1 Tax=Pontibacter amylolyticus TaxID=1424080 RepID=A0ABQ1W873_9BACT|nr:hypothetical protein [Pontibacter amylolyticus]GGG18585.1 hypothetical protein GCM10011323_23410 [Pontibacter amylolyticus]